MKPHIFIIALSLVSCCISSAQENGADKPKVTLPGLTPVDSPASLIKRNADGTLLVTMKPKVYLNGLGCTMVSDENGNTFSQMYHVIRFKSQNLSYYTIWGARYGKKPPVKLNGDKEYKFLIKSLNRNASKKNADNFFEIVTIWDGDKVVFDKPKK